MKNNDFLYRYFLSVTPISIMGIVNKNAQIIRMHYGSNIYNNIYTPDTSSLIINHASSFATPFVCISLVTCALKLTFNEDSEEKIGRNALYSTVVFSGYELWQADFKPTKIDQGDMVAVFLASALFYGVYSKKMPWNKPSSKKIQTKNAPTPQHPDPVPRDVSGFTGRQPRR